MSSFTESIVDNAALAWLEALGWTVRSGLEIAPGEIAERRDYGQVVLQDRLRQALVRLNPELPSEALEDAYRKVTHADAPSLVKRILRKYGYPPDKQEKATQTVLEQAEVLSAEWAVA